MIVKIREGIGVNLSMAVSHAIEYDLPIRALKPEVKEALKKQTLGREINSDDYIEEGRANTVMFWFIGGASLTYRVGHEITQEDFDRIEATLENVTYRLRDAGKQSTDKADRTA